jgi:hypothetical protein
LKFAGSVGPKLLIPSLEKHQEWLGRIPEWVAADAGFFNNENESKVQVLGVKKLAIPNKKTRSPARLALQRQRWFRRAQLVNKNLLRVAENLEERTASTFQQG